MCERRKKYRLLQDFSHLKVDILTELEKDDGTLVSHHFTTNTHGGANKLWEFNDLEGQVATVSTGATSFERVNSQVSVPIYKHYVLTDEGFQWIRGQLMENI
jgi:hypothetical protein